jgi:hypothetical protein
MPKIEIFKFLYSVIISEAELNNAPETLKNINDFEKLEFLNRENL